MIPSQTQCQLNNPMLCHATNHWMHALCLLITQSVHAFLNSEQVPITLSHKFGVVKFMPSHFMFLGYCLVLLF